MNAQSPNIFDYNNFRKFLTDFQVVLATMTLPPNPAESPSKAFTLVKARVTTRASDSHIANHQQILEAV